MKQILLLFLIISIYSCSTQNDKEKSNEDKTKNSLFSLLPAEKTRIDFTNVLNETATQNIYSYQYFYNGAGVATGDINNDGLVDVFFAANQNPCQLFLNKGNMKFENITASSKIATTGWCTGASIADVNGDGWLDIYVCRSQDSSDANRANFLYINNQNSTFTEQAAQYGVDDKGYASQGYFFDYDNDNDLDLFICNHPYTWDNKIEKQAIQNAIEDPYATDRLYRNDENKFTDVTKAVGVHSFAFSLSAAITDYNNDGFQDIYVCNDYTMNDFLYINNGNGTFTDKIFEYFNHTSFYSMGSDMGDVNNDGLVDLVTLDMLPEDSRRQHLNMMRVDYDKYMAGVKWGFGYAYMYNNLQLNQGNNHFAEIGQLAGIEATDWSWTPLLEDFNNDGYVDLYVTNGYKRDFTNADFIVYEGEQARQQMGKAVSILDLLNNMPSIKINNYLYLNNGDLTFKNATEQNLMNIPSFSQGAAYADLDNDGDMDIVVNNINDPAFVFENNSKAVIQNHFVNIELKGNGKNTQAIGATVNLKSQEGIQMRSNMPMRGFLSTSQSLMHFGLGKNSGAVTATITWSDGKQQTVNNLKIDNLNTITYSPNVTNENKNETTGEKIFADVTKKSKLDYQHTENDYIDFKREPLLPQKYSENGPGVAVGDVNGDGMDDVFIGNSKSGSGKFFLQQKDGTFSPSPSPDSYWGSLSRNADDMGCLLFDADNDGDNDFYIVSGGSEYDDSTAYNDYLFLNDGKGYFTEGKNLLPSFNSSGSCIVAGDYDADGDLDLFRGGRIIPGQFPVAPRSFLLRNDKGKFTDVTASAAPDLVKPGLVCAALFTDYDNNGTLDLIVTGEWMPIMILKNSADASGRKFINETEKAGLNQSNGWWNSMSAADFNNDGLQDYIIGNRGLNSRIRASKEQPACIMYKDFDANGSLDALLCTYYPDGKNYPLVGRDEFIDQMRIMKKRLLRYDDYSGKTLNEIFTPEEMQGAQVANAYTFASACLLNKGNGAFELKNLHTLAQLAPVYGIITNDFDNDGNMDAMLTGNFYGAEVNLGRSDASSGLFLKGDGKGSFSSLNSLQSGLYAAGNSKGSAAVFINATQSYSYIIANNDDKAQVVKSNRQEAKGNFVFKPLAADCKLTYADASGKKHVHEIYYGSGYVSSSTRTLILPANATAVEVTDSKGNKRMVK